MSTAVYFNLDGTLTEHDINYEQVYDAAVQAAGLDAVQDAYGPYTDTFFDYFQDGWVFPRRRAMLDLVREHSIDHSDETDRFAETWEDREAEQTTVRDSAEQVLQELQEGYELGVLTNGTGRLQRMKLEQASLAEYFSTLVISSEVGMVKPHSEIFEEAQDQIDADDYVIVSQELRRDILPGKRAGYKTVWVSDADTEDNPQMQELVDAQVASLEQVPDAVRQITDV